MLERVTFKCELVAYDNVEETFGGRRHPHCCCCCLLGAVLLKLMSSSSSPALSVWLSGCLSVGCCGVIVPDDYYYYDKPPLDFPGAWFLEASDAGK
jgi:hypothetical protein